MLDRKKRNKINMYKKFDQKCGKVDKNVEKLSYLPFQLFHIQNYTDFYIRKNIVK